MSSAILSFINITACLVGAILFYYGAKNDYAKNVGNGYVAFGLGISAVFAAGFIINVIQLAA